MWKVNFAILLKLSTDFAEGLQIFVSTIPLISFKEKYLGTFSTIISDKNFNNLKIR